MHYLTGEAQTEDPGFAPVSHSEELALLGPCLWKFTQSNMLAPMVPSICLSSPYSQVSSWNLNHSPSLNPIQRRGRKQSLVGTRETVRGSAYLLVPVAMQQNTPNLGAPAAILLFSQILWLKTSDRI
jgi:hypothetical protein